MLFAGIHIIGEYLEARLKEHFKELEEKRKECGVKLPPLPKPIFTGSTKNLTSMKAKPGSKSGENLLLIHFDRANVKNYGFESIEFKAYFHLLVGTKSFMSLADMLDVIMNIHGAPLNIEEFENVFTKKGYVKPEVHIKNVNVLAVNTLNSVEQSIEIDMFRVKITLEFDTLIYWSYTNRL